MKQPFDIELTEAQYEFGRDYWQGLAEDRAVVMKQLVVILVDGAVRYRAWPKRESVFKGIPDEQLNS